MDPIERALTDQKLYYQLRASEYDQWWLRTGRYNRGSEATTTWFEEAAQVRATLRQFNLEGSLLEIASGTGIWTEELIKTASSVTALDASAAMLALNHTRVNSERVTYRVADVFEWEPPHVFDAVFFSFWLSHVPRQKLNAFFQKVNALLKPGGKLFFVDGLRQPTSTATNHQLPAEESEVMTRTLNDGQHFDIIKVFYSPTELVAACEKTGLAITIQQTSTYFYSGSGYKV